MLLTPFVPRRFLSSRRPWMRGAVIGLLTAIGGALSIAATAHAGAVVYGATLERETALVALRDGRQSTVLSITVAADPTAADAARRRPAVVVPVPAAPAAAALTGPSAAVFAELDAATAPRTPASEAARLRGDVPRPEPGPFVDYEITELPAGDQGALTAWLRRHDLTTPPAQARELRRYADADWAFVVLRLRDPVDAEQTLRPLRIEVPSDRVRFPMRVLGAGSDPVSVALYVAGPHRVTAEGFGTYHAGRVEDLVPSPNPDVQALLGDAAFLTKLGTIGTPPEAIDGDVATEQGVSDRLFRASVDYPFESEAGFATAPLPDENAPEVPFDGPPGWLWLVLVAGVVALVALVGLVLRWRGRHAA